MNLEIEIINYNEFIGNPTLMVSFLQVLRLSNPILTTVRLKFAGKLVSVQYI